MEYSLKLAEPTDRAWLEALRREAYSDLFASTWGGWDEERHQRHFSECWKSGNIQMIVVSGSPVGMLQIFESEEEFQIGELQIISSSQKQGLGARVLNDVIDKAKDACKNVTLSTGLKNAGAVKLYKKVGFEEVRRSATHVHMTYVTCSQCREDAGQ